MQPNQRGFIALTSAIIISFLLITITVSLAFSGFFHRFNILDLQSKQQSQALAEGCVNAAILKIINNKNYVLTSQDHHIQIENGVCNIISLSPNVPRTFPITIQTQAVTNNAYTNLEVSINEHFEIILWKEIPKVE